MEHEPDNDGDVILFVRRFSSENSAGEQVLKMTSKPGSQTTHLSPIAGVTFRLTHHGADRR
jgi:hypothetical protein